MGYKEASELYKKRYGKYAKSSWIADILNEHGKTKTQAHSRSGPYKYPCPNDVRSNLENILKDLNMI